MVRSLKERLKRLQEYASKTEYATTDECISQLENTKGLIVFWDNIGFCDD